MTVIIGEFFNYIGVWERQEPIVTKNTKLNFDEFIYSRGYTGTPRPREGQRQKRDPCFALDLDPLGQRTGLSAYDTSGYPAKELLGDELFPH